MKKPLLIAIPLAMSAGLLAATPASAADWNSGKQIRTELRMLDQQIDRTRGLSKREEASLERRVDSAQALQRRYARNGYSRTELRNLSHQVTSIKAALRTQSRDNNGKASKRNNSRR